MHCITNHDTKGVRLANLGVFTFNSKRYERYKTTIDNLTGNNIEDGEHFKDPSK